MGRAHGHASGTRRAFPLLRYLRRGAPSPRTPRRDSRPADPGSARRYGRSTARRGPARKPASTRSCMTSVSATGDAVEALDGEALRAARPHVRDERGECRPKPLRDRALGAERASVRLARRRARLRRRAARPRRRRPVPLARRSVAATAAQHRTAAPDRRQRARAPRARLRAAPREARAAARRPREGELRSAEPLDEVAAPADAERLERLQLRVHGSVPAADPLAANAVARDDPLSLEQELGERAAIGSPANSARRERPSPLRRRRGRSRACARSAARAIGSRQLVPPRCAKRRPRVVRDLSRPDELPERRRARPRREARSLDEIGPEECALRERGADRGVDLALGRRLRRGGAEHAASSRK